MHQKVYCFFQKEWITSKTVFFCYLLPSASIPKRPYLDFSSSSESDNDANKEKEEIKQTQRCNEQQFIDVQQQLKSILDLLQPKNSSPSV